MNASPRQHGGPDAQGAARWDFSTCANAAGPCAAAQLAVTAADMRRYPDPSSQALKTCLAAWHGVAPQRILLAASASEFIQRITAVGALLAPGPVLLPRHAYGDYAAAASAWRRECRHDDQPGSAGATPSLRWIADPNSPLGQDAAPPLNAGELPTVLDAVYLPLRLQGHIPWQPADLDSVFVLHSPNKALGLCGVRGAYAVAPSRADWDVAAWCHQLEAAAPSWPLSAQGVAMLQAWPSAAVQHWLLASHAMLRQWKKTLLQALQERGFVLADSQTSFFCVQPPRPLDAARLRQRGVALRDATSFGLPGWWRLSVQPPAAITALCQALDAQLDGGKP